MMTCTDLQADAIWLELRNYEIVPLNAQLTSRIHELSRTLRQGVAACPDKTREGFYTVELDKGYAYIHIHPETRTAYLVAAA